MPLGTLLTFAVLLTTISSINNYPQTNPPRTKQTIPPRTPLAILSLPTTNLTFPLTPPNEIRCIRNLSRPTTDVSTCRPTLNHFRTFPNYRRFQSFQEGRYPKLPSPPPYAVHQTQSTCAVQIASGDPAIVDDFSFEQARALGADILEVCEGHGYMRGGVAPIGHGIGWKVVVVGFRMTGDGEAGRLDGGVVEVGG